MSQESAQRILQMYMQDNTNRINQALQLAFQEAQQLDLNEQATRKLLTDVLKEQQSSLNEYIDVLQKARTAQRRGQFDLARANIQQYNQDLAAYNRDQEQYQREIQSLGAQNQAVAQKAEEESDALYFAEAGDLARLQSTIGKLGQGISNRLYTQQGDIYAVLESEGFTAELASIASKYAGSKYQTDQLKLNGQTYPRRTTGDFKVSDLYHQIMEDLAVRTGLSKNDPLLQAVSNYMLDPSKTGGYGGGLQNAAIYDESIIKQNRDSYATDLTESRSKKPTMKKPVRPSEKEVATQTEAEKELVIAAQPVLDALGANDDTPYQLTEEERRSLSVTSLQAYKDLQDAFRRNPNVVNLDQAVLLDEIALDRALKAEQTTQQLRTPAKKPQSLEVTMTRAAEIAEPRLADKQRGAMAARPAHEQKYFASERKALELSDQDDNYVRNMGTPELYGVTKWKEVWNGKQMSSDYGTIVSDIEQQFPNPEDQLKALAAFNSRAMKLQRAKSPIMLEGGKLSEDYKAALEAMTPKE